MNFQKSPDAINSIIKSINPIHPSFSRQNKEYNKHFVSLNLDVANFMKTLNRINKRKISNSNIYESLFKKNETNKFVYEEDIQKTFNKLNKLRDNKYLPKDLIEKFKFSEMVTKKEKKKNINSKMKSKYRKKKVQIKEDFYNEITLDPGRYNPRYGLIFKKIIPNIYFQKNKFNFSNNDNISIKDESTEKENNEVNKVNEKVKEELEQKNVIQKLIEQSKNKESKFITLNEIVKFRKNNIKRIISSNFNNNNKDTTIFSSSMIDFKPNNNIISHKFQNTNLKQLNRTHSSGFFQNIHKNKKVSSANLKYDHNYNFLFESNYRNNFEEVNAFNRCKSCKYTTKRIFSFNRMKGRNKNLFGGKENKENVVFNQNYQIISPIYLKGKTKYENLQKLKKHAVNKIIRNYYCFSKNDYFIFDINRKNKTIDKNYITSIYKKYNI